MKNGEFMKILTYPDWKKRIPFDNIIYKDVKRFCLQLNTRERKIMDVEIDFYRKHFSLQQIIDHFKILKTKKDKETFIKAVLKRKENILYMPFQMKSFYTKKIKKEMTEYKDFFLIMLDKALNQVKKNPITKMIKTILGEYYSPVMSQVKKISRRTEIPILQHNIKPEGIENTARNIIRDLQYDLQLSKIYGRSGIRKTVPISVLDDYGYGEWISKNVTYNNNRFFIYSNKNKITDVQLRHMVYFNVYPGYGHFYNTVVDDVTKRISFDNGATFLINGWAMYAMCTNKYTAYSQNFLIEGTTIVKSLMRKNLEKAFEEVYIYIHGRYSKDKAMNYMLDYTQYPGHYLSYVLGCLAIDECIQKGFAHNPIDFLKTMSSINCGDYFALYSPKMQKKIAKESITAKVSQKFV